MRAVFFGLVLIAALSAIVLSIRPGGLRRQLRLAARRLRLVLILGGVYLIFSTVIRVFFPNGWVADYAPPVMALVLAGAFLVLAQDPAPPPETKR
jgi:SNF family Na+-dependent transporter